MMYVLLVIKRQGQELLAQSLYLTFTLIFKIQMIFQREHVAFPL